jgi:hypothetical protein
MVRLQYKEKIMQNKLSKIKKIDLRKAWNHEAHDFTLWLSNEENLNLLSDEIGIDIKLIQTEANVGKFHVDILCEEENSSRKVIIENQLEITNHDHLGKIITYASGIDAEIIVWIVKDVREEHKQAIDWLNEHTDENIAFFAIKMELWQIDDSPFAPKFQLISQPNDWAKTIKGLSKNNLSETKIKQLEFWNGFIEYCKKHESKLKLRKANPQHWYDISLGNSHSHLGLTINTQDNAIAVDVYIPDNKELFDKLFENKDKLEKELGKRLSWQRLEGKKAARIKWETQADINDTEKWESQFAWLKEKAELMHKVFSKNIKNTKR